MLPLQFPLRGSDLAARCNLQQGLRRLYGCTLWREWWFHTSVITSPYESRSEGPSVQVVPRVRFATPKSSSTIVSSSENKKTIARLICVKRGACVRGNCSSVAIAVVDNRARIGGPELDHPAHPHQLLFRLSHHLSPHRRLTCQGPKKRVWK
ncbi:hypothetical protein SETIT_9G034800v2 [Setaria italica]|uniref:Uncharacterized protein n=1 Tax=Setaria italica TaxID=4555 RepID=A0A368SCP7_SETIT|nr:hypothetical protein SETIT_9G034800v2 [Setaria italica]